MTPIGLDEFNFQLQDRNQPEGTVLNVAWQYHMTQIVKQPISIQSNNAIKQWMKLRCPGGKVKGKPSLETQRCASVLLHDPNGVLRQAQRKQLCMVRGALSIQGLVIRYTGIWIQLRHHPLDRNESA